MKLSVFVVTYNQEKYIRQCLDSILMQNVNFEYEVIIGEDCSTDSTPQICDEYVAKYPFINVYHHPQNIGLVKNWEFVLNKCTGDYVAMIEGDDYWVDSDKLQKQVDWLDSHPDYVITSTNVNVICEGGLNDAHIWFKPRHTGDVQIEEYINPGICHTTSVVMRNLTKNIVYPQWVYITDSYTFMWVAKQGKAYHFEDKLSVYRRHTENCTTMSSSNNISAMIKWAEQHKNMQKEFPELINLLQSYEESDLKYLSSISISDSTDNLWKYRIRYAFMRKKLFFSSYLIRTIFYLPFIKKLKVHK